MLTAGYKGLLIIAKIKSMLLLLETMVDKIPWDTCVIALIFGVFKTEF